MEQRGTKSVHVAIEEASRNRTIMRHRCKNIQVRYYELLHAKSSYYVIPFQTISSNLAAPRGNCRNAPFLS
jgi:hypothetical protein